MNLKPDVALSDDEWIIVRNILQTYLKDHAVWAFGSRARHTHHPYSDLDIVIIGDQALTFATMGDLRQAFQESALPWKVDLVDWHDIGIDFKQIIDAHKIRLQ